MNLTWNPVQARHLVTRVIVLRCYGLLELD
nr:MAG TPA: hypothetical protein [Caudoviricetes sp.]